MQQGLESAWNCTKAAGLDCGEPWSVITTVDSYREYWHPGYALWKKPRAISESAEGDHPTGGVRVLLLAESHKCTDAKMHGCSFAPGGPLHTPAPTGLLPHRGYPAKYVKFVYNLGYGEQGLYAGMLPPPAGTWQFWTIFAACSLGGFASRAGVLKTTTMLLTPRLKNKINLLCELQDRGIWLLDASVVGKRDRLSAADYRKYIECSWCNTTAARITKENPDHIIVIGKNVKNVFSHQSCGNQSGTAPYATRGSISIRGYAVETGTILGIDATVINQPQARITAAQREAEMDLVHDILSEYRAIATVRSQETCQIARRKNMSENFAGGQICARWLRENLVPDSRVILSRSSVLTSELTDAPVDGPVPLEGTVAELSVGGVTIATGKIVSCEGSWFLEIEEVGKGES